MSDKQRRNGHRIFARRTISTISDLLICDQIDSAKLGVQVKLLKDQQSKIVILDDTIQMSLSDEDDLLKDMGDSLKVSTEIEECLERAERNILTLVNFSTGATNSIAKVAKLPTLNMRKFQGDPLDWPQFWDAFLSSIDSRRDVTDSQKFGYLMGLLEDEALRTLDGFTITNVNYAEAKNLLSKTYGKPNVIIQAHLHAIMDLECIGATSNNLRGFRTSYECHLRGLKTMKMKVEEAGYVFVTMLLRKLPNKVRDNINRANKSDVWDLQLFREAIDNEIELLKAVEPIKQVKNSNEIMTNCVEKFKKGENIKQKPTVGTFSVLSNSKDSCQFCLKEHKSVNCNEYKSNDDRVEKAKEMSLCFNCLRSNHSVFACKVKTRCFNCKKKHHTALCRTDNVVNETVATIKSTNLESDIQSVALPTGIIPVKTKDALVNIRALFDQCSQRTFILKERAKNILQKTKRRVELCIDGFASKGKSMVYDVIEFTVEIEKPIPIEAVVVDTLPSRIKILGISLLVQKLKSEGVRLADCCLDDDKVNNIDILIGADQYYKFVHGLTAFGDIHLISSVLGMMITGPLKEEMYVDNSTKFENAKSNPILVCKINEADVVYIDENMKNMWSLDAIGIQENNDSEDNIMTEFKQSIKYRHGQYIVRLPWKSEGPQMKSNYGLALGRLKTTLTKLRRNPDHLSIYSTILEDYKKKNFIEEVDNSVIKYSSKKHYLSHHGVMRDSTTTPLRIVFDCSAGSPSLNDCLHTGPCLLNELCKVLMRFRVGIYAAVSDICKAFLMINLAEEDRNYTLFMWPKDPTNENSELCTYRFRVVLFGATCSPFLLQATILHHLDQYADSIALRIERNIYVDNLQSVCNNELEILEFYGTVKEIFASANLTLREWVSNSSALKKEIVRQQDGCSENVFQKVLGMQWRIEDDILFCGGAPNAIDKENFSKRNILSSISRVFDPLGFLTPITIRAKIFMQQLWQEKVAWDDVIVNEESYSSFQTLLRDLQIAINLGVPRALKIKGTVELHAFSDASSKAYGSVIYLCSNKKSSLVCSKSRVTPLKELSIPKLELTSATLSIRLVSYVLDAYKSEIEFSSVTYWTDSKVVLYWISRKNNLKTYENNRVNEICSKSTSKQWRYINTKENPADILSRGLKADKLLTSDLWFHGPEWLSRKSDWPAESEFDSSNFKIPYEKDLVTSAIVADTPARIMPLFDPQRVSLFTSLLRVTAIALKFLKLIKVSKTNREEGTLNSKDIAEAKLYWICFVQQESFHEEMSYLQNTKGKTPNIVKQLNLFMHDQVLHCRGRVQHAEIDWNSKYPILLPTNHAVTTLIIKDAHNRVHHLGASAVVEHLRRTYWIARMRQVVKSTIRTCVTCKRIQGAPFRAPACPPMPKFRIGETSPFTNTGIDYTGALFVKVAKEQQKAYIVLFTCAVTRAIHLEVVQDNTKESFLYAFRRFIGRRSCPRMLISDNSQTFASSAKFLKKLQRDPMVQRELSDRICEWKFIPARSPWQGGFWERLISLTKSSLKKILGRASISLEELQTLVVEIEATLNDRPITFASDNIEDLNALTPSQLLYGYKLGKLPDFVPEKDPDFGASSKSELSARQRFYTRLRMQFWNRWRHEYVLALRERSSNSTKNGPQIQVNDIVIIHDTTPRIRWKMGRVIQLHQSDDGEIRSVLLKTENGHITRPIVKLYPLEVRCESMMAKNIDTNNINNVRPNRAAAVIARKRIAEIDI